MARWLIHLTLWFMGRNYVRIVLQMYPMYLWLTVTIAMSSTTVNRVVAQCTCAEKAPCSILRFQEGVGSCRSEESTDCANRLILTAQGKRASSFVRKDQPMSSVDLFGLDTNLFQEKPLPSNRNIHPKYSNFILLPPPIQNQKVIVNVPFDCKGRIDGHWRDVRYCDVFHACIAGEQKRSYGCNQIGERFYFDDASQK